ncbi:MAG: NERD domain-containing protein [Chloroflexi bacterium]|nr:NERD domain-containing protein [Chloroflexota bacterium]
MTELRRIDRTRVHNVLEARLMRDLPDDYIGVVQPLIHGQTLDAVIVAPQGLYVLHALDWVGEVTPTTRGRWSERTPDGKVVHHVSPAEAAQRAESALLAFLKDEFPKLKPVIRHYAVLVDPAAQVVTGGTSRPPCVTLESLVRELLAAPTPAGAPLARPEARQELALALDERQLTRNQRATEPFIFRSGGSLGRGVKAHTVRQVIRHVDRYPDDGVYHLRNGTLEQWFTAQGALHLARLARQALQGNLRDARAALESFMISSGMVTRPRLVSVPRKLDLGFVLEGEPVHGTLAIRKGRGRGYLFGRAESSEPWMQVVPAEFEGALQAGITVDTSTLAIKDSPWHAAVRIHSSASEEPLETPVVVRVVPASSKLTSIVVRPLIGLLIGAALGTAIGYWLGPGGMDPPFGLRDITDPPLTLRQAWMLVCGVIWALFGLFRGFSWDRIQPTGRCVASWLFRVLLWGLTLTALAFASPWLARWAFPTYTETVPARVEQSIKLVAVTLAIIPGTWGGIISDRTSKTTGKRSRALRGLLRGVVASLVVAALLILLRVGRPLWHSVAAGERFSDARGWVAERWEALGDWVDGLWGDAYLRENDRRAPTRVRPTVTSEPEGASVSDESSVQ